MSDPPTDHRSPAISTFLSSSLLGAEKLSDDNWVEWSENMEMFFLGAQAEWVTSGVVEAGHEKLDKSLIAYIYASLEPEQRYRLKNIKSAVAAWTTLKLAYNKSTMGRRIRARDAIDAVEHDPSRPMDFYIQSIVTAFEVLKNLGETVSETAIGDHLLRHLDASYHPVRTTILAQETEPTLAKIKAILLGSASSEYSVKIESGLAARSGGRNVKGGGAEKPKFRQEPATDGFREGKFLWCSKDNDDSCHRCGRDGHISRLCARDMPTSVKDLVIQGARAHAARRAFTGDLAEQESPNEDADADEDHHQSGHRAGYASYGVNSAPRRL